MSTWNVVEVETSRGKIRAAYMMASCGTGDCLVIAYTVAGQPRLLLVPSQPSPWCLRGDRVDAETVRSIVQRLPGALGYVPSFCRVSRRLLAESLEETIRALEEEGLLR